MHGYRLSFKAPFHVDSRGNDNYEQVETFIRSDTLSAAILSVWGLLEPQGLAERAKLPPFRLSSAFPYFDKLYFNSDNQVWYFNNRIFYFDTKIIYSDT